MNHELYDLAVVGAGPAGCSAAITTARSGFRVILLEAGAFPRHKVCGEFVSSEALALLSELLEEGPIVDSAPRMDHARLFIDGRVLTFPVQPAATSISRFQLDEALWRAAEQSGVTCCKSTRVSAVQRSANDSFVLKLQSGELRARSVINAAGRWSNLTSERRISKLTQRWIGVKAHFHEEHTPASCDLYFFDGGYCGVQPVGDGVVNASAIVRADVATNLGRVFDQNAELWKRSRSWSAHSEPVNTSPLMFTAPITSRDNVLLCGDAAAFIDPFAGDGISMALHSGRLAARALTGFLSGRRTLADAIHSYADDYRRMVQPTLKSAAGLRRLLALPAPIRAGVLSLLSLRPVAAFAVRQTRLRIKAA